MGAMDRMKADIHALRRTPFLIGGSVPDGPLRMYASEYNLDGDLVSDLGQDHCARPINTEELWLI